MRSLIEAPDGLLYGVTYAAGAGAVIRLKKDGSEFMLIKTFAFEGVTGLELMSGLIPTADGAIYGVTCFGGELGLGSVFRLTAWRPPRLRLQVTTASFAIHIVGQSGDVYSMEATDMFPTEWAQIGTVTNTTGDVEFTDSPKLPSRIYRARVLSP